jgi:hypothetical protein
MYMGLGPVVTSTCVLVHEILDRGANAAVRGGALSTSQVLDRGAQADLRGAAQVLDRDSQADATVATCMPFVPPGEHNALSLRSSQSWKLLSF